MATSTRGLEEAGRQTSRVSIEWLPTAEQDRESQLSYIAERNPLAAINMGDAVENTVRHLGNHPRLGRPGRVTGTRELPVAGTPYLIVYRIERGSVVILRLLHGARKWPEQF